MQGCYDNIKIKLINKGRTGELCNMSKISIKKEINKSCGKTILISIFTLVIVTIAASFISNEKVYDLIKMAKEFKLVGVGKLKNIKMLSLVIYCVLGVVALVSVFSIIKSLWYFINKKQHFMYRQIRDIGDEDRLIEIIERETSESAILKKVGKNYITSNWFIFNTGFNYVFVPHKMLVWIYKKKKRSLYNLLFNKSCSIEIYLLNGNNYSIPVNKEEADLIIENVKSKLPMLNTKRTLITWLEWTNEKDEIKKQWKNITSNNSNIYFYLQDESLKDMNGYELNEVLELRRKVLEKIREISLIINDEEVELSECINLRNGIIMFPAKELFKELGGKIEEEDDDEDNTLLVNIYGKYIYLDGNDGEIFVNNTLYQCNTPVLLENDVIYVPSEVITEVLNQQVQWDEEKSVVKMTKKAEKYTMKQLHWGYSVGAILSKCNDQDIELLGGTVRNDRTAKGMKESLEEWWGIENRQDMLEMIKKLKNGLHNRIFMDTKRKVDTLNDEEFQAEVDSFPQLNFKRDLQIVKKYSKEVGQVGILGWDLSRLINITGWGYIAGYLDYDEANDIIMDTARVVQKKFSSWEEIWKNYLIGFEYWSGDSLEDSSSHIAMRYDIYNDLLDDEDGPCNTLKWNLNLNPATIE